MKVVLTTAIFFTPALAQTNDPNTGQAAGAAVIASALNLLEARARFDAPERAVNIRVAEHARPPLS